MDNPDSITMNGKHRIAILGSYVPRRCGIATFTHDLGNAIALHCTDRPITEGANVEVVAVNDQEQGYPYGDEVTIQIRQYQREDYRNAAEILNTSRIDMVLLQHEYGLFGGNCGEYLFELVGRLRKPLVTTLHSVLSDPTAKQKEVLTRICEQSSMVVVMATRARVILNESYGVPLERIKLVPHGVPDLPFGSTEPFKERFGLTGRPMILTFGLLGPGKSIEVTLDALAKVVVDHPNVAYVVLGVTHPAIRRESGEHYRLSLERRAVELGIQSNVLFHNRYVSNEDLGVYLQAADIYVTPYKAKEQITSGTLAYAVAAGKAVISTPYWHAQELLANGRGCLVEFGNSDGFADAIGEFLTDTDKRNAARKAAYSFGRSMVWPEVAEQYVTVIEQAVRTHASRPPASVADRKVVMRTSLPSVRLQHFFAMTDDTGMLQHSRFATPDRRHGYCSDDNARAAIVAAMCWSQFQDETMIPYLARYLSFLDFAHIPETGRFKNFMSYDRRWLENDGSDDCQGRVIWALGYLTSHAPNEATQRMAEDLFRSAVRSADTLQWERSRALAILGMHYYLRKHPGDSKVRELKTKLADRINEAFAQHESKDWPWFENQVTYDNGRLPQAMIIAGVQLDRKDLVDRGLRVLQWLVDAQTAPEGHLTIIGNQGWMKRNDSRAKFDQQPLEPAALIGACKAAYRASGENRWLVEMRRCFEWYLGRNDLGISVVDFKSRGCFDGLSASGLNENQGAESLLSWLLSLLIMHEMQTGDAPEVG